MDRRGEEDRQALVRIVAVLLALAIAAEAAGALPSRNRIVVLAIVRHAAAVACAFAASIHAPHVPVECHCWPAPASGEVEAARFAAIFRALAVALAVPARQAIRAARWLAHRSSSLPGEYPAAGFAPHLYLAAEPCFADTS